MYLQHAALVHQLEPVQIDRPGPGSTVFLPRCCAQYAAPPIISLKICQSGSRRESHSFGLFGWFQSSIHSK